MRTSWHAREPEAIAANLHTDLVRGLTERDARARLSSEGANELPEPPAPSPLYLLLGQFASVIIWVLIGAAVISGLLQEWIDAGAILAIVSLNALLGFVQAFKAERSLAALRNLSIATARVVREGVVRAIPARELAPGDLIQIEAGDHVPADARLIYATNLFAQEAALTGESTVVEKSAALLSGETIPLSDRIESVISGNRGDRGERPRPRCLDRFTHGVGSDCLAAAATTVRGHSLGAAAQATGEPSALLISSHCCGSVRVGAPPGRTVGRYVPDRGELGCGGDS